MATDTPLLGRFVNTMIVNQWFWFSHKYDPNSKLDYDLKQLTVSKLDKHLKENYTLDAEELNVVSCVARKLAYLKMKK